MAGEFPALQMICERQVPAPADDEPTPVPLTPTDVPAMLRLVELTEPGPFLPRTIVLGPYLSLWQDGERAELTIVALERL